MTRVNKPISLTRYLIEQQREKGVIKPDLRLLIEVVARACKTIATQINKGALGGEHGRARVFGGVDGGDGAGHHAHVA